MRNWMRSVGIVGAVGLVVPFALAADRTTKQSQGSIDKGSIKTRLAAEASKFAENVGQWDKQALFLSRGKGHDFWITRQGATFDFYVKKGNSGVRRGHVVRMSYVGAEGSMHAVGADKRVGHYDFIGKNRASRSASRFGEVRHDDVYKGVDVRYYLDGGRPRYDFVVEPNADTSAIKIRFDGAKTKAVNGAIVLDTTVGQVQHQRPVAFQYEGILRKPVSAKYVQAKDGTFALALGKYDHSKQLIVDPLVYGSYYGGDFGNDEVRSVVSDTDGGVYITGSTTSAQFPALQGPYGFNSVGGTDAFVAKLQGDAYSNIYAAYYGGSLDEAGQYLQLDPFGNLWVAGTFSSSDLPGNSRRNVQFIRLNQRATGGTFRLNYGGFATTQNIPWNATPAQVETRLETDFGFLGDVVVESVDGGLLANGSEYRLSLDPTQPFVFQGLTTVGQGGVGLEARLTLISLTPDPPGVPETIIRWDTGSRPTGGTWFLRYGDQQTTALRFDATAAQVQTALNALNNLNNGRFTVTGGPLPGAQLVIRYFAQNAIVPSVPPNALADIDTGLQPRPLMSVEKNTDIFVMRWRRDATKILDPGDGIPQSLLVFGGDRTEGLAGFGVVQSDNPETGAPVVFGFGGTTPGALDPGLAAGSAANSNTFVARYRFDGAFTRNATGTKFLEGTVRQQLGGFTIDRQGNGYVAGMVLANFNSDAPGALFPVLNTFPDGDKLRLIDTFVRKYGEDGTMQYSNLLGGNDFDTIGGVDVDAYGVAYNSGSAIAVDNGGNAYVTGVSRSFNFPRTRGVFGETFSSARVVFVTKISPDGKSIVYSTNLRTAGNVNPAGIAVDEAGNAFVTGMLRPNFQDFPATNGQMPGDPNEPVANAANTLLVQLQDALDPTYDFPAAPVFPTTEGFLNVLNPTATQLVFGTYIGGILDDQVYAPYVDRFGDVWVMGYTDFQRNYVRQGTTTIQIRNVGGGGLPAALLSPLAFKSSVDPAATDVYDLIYGGYGDRGGQTHSPFTVPVNIARDGYLIKLRVGTTPNVQNLTLNPSTIPGGLGASSTGTVTLSSAAPAGGADVQVTIDDTAVASLSATGVQGSTVVTIPAGETVGTFTVFSRAVTINRSVQVRATYLGSFLVRQLNVVPWLQSLALTPNDIVGGNNGTGRITLAAPAPAGGISVELSTDTPSLISFPAGATVPVPAGQTSVTFNYSTQGVAATTFAGITASAEGVNRSAALTLRTAGLLSLTFAPSEIAGLGTTTGTLLLDGKAGSTFTVNLSIDGNPSGYTFPSTVTFAAGESSKTFTVRAPIEPSRVTRRVIANRPATGAYLASQVDGTFAVLVATVKSFTIAPKTVASGGTVTGTVELTSPAPQGGVAVEVLFNTNQVTAPTTVIVPSGSATANFTITARVVPVNTNATITVRRTAADAKSDTLTILAGEFGLSINPGSVLGGRENSVGTITLNAPAGPLGLTINLSSSNAAASVPATVTIPAGQTTVTFPITTSTVTSNRTITITASTAGFSTTSEITVRANGVALLSINPSKVRGGQSVSVTITLDAVAGAGGQVVNLSTSNASLFTSFPATRTVPAGQRTVTFSLVTRRVSLNRAVSITASAAGSSATAGLTIVR